VLAALSVGGGVLLVSDWIVHWLEPVIGEAVEHEPPLPLLVITGLTLVVVAVGVALAWLLFGRERIPATAPTNVSPLTVAARRNLYGDAVNEALLMRPGQYLTRFLVFFDNRGVDGAVNGLAALIGGSSGRARRWQTGFVRSYALSMLAGSALVVVALLAVSLG
jgi:NADH-quinone oxidoreductase subunit L